MDTSKLVRESISKDAGQDWQLLLVLVKRYNANLTSRAAYLIADTYGVRYRPSSEREGFLYHAREFKAALQAHALMEAGQDASKDDAATEPVEPAPAVKFREPKLVKSKQPKPDKSASAETITWIHRDATLVWYHGDSQLLSQTVAMGRVRTGLENRVGTGRRATLYCQEDVRRDGADDKWLTIVNASKQSGKRASSILRWSHTGKVRFYRPVNAAIRVHIDDVMDAARRSDQNPAVIAESVGRAQRKVMSQAKQQQSVPTPTTATVPVTSRAPIHVPRQAYVDVLNWLYATGTIRERQHGAALSLYDLDVETAKGSTSPACDDGDVASETLPVEDLT